MKRKVYLAGSMSGRDWREVIAERRAVGDALREIGFDVIDPCRGKRWQEDHVISYDAESEGISAKMIIARDLRDVQESDFLVVLTGDLQSFGTTAEWTVAYWLRKPVFVIATKSEAEMGTWRCALATGGIFKSAEALVEHMKQYWVDGLELQG